jgi:predicted transposase YbfD/YdcC
VEEEKNHGRHSFWYVSVFNARTSFKADEWKSLSRFIHVHKCTIKKGKEIYSNRFYMSDERTIDAKYFHEGIRGHWKIENNLHWVKDVIHKEDDNRIRTNNGPVNSAIFSSIAINLHRKNGNYSITDGQIKFGAKVKDLFGMLRT